MSFKEASRFEINQFKQDISFEVGRFEVGPFEVIPCKVIRVDAGPFILSQIKGKMILGYYSGNSTFRQTYKSCNESFVRGGVVPEPGKPGSLSPNSTLL